MKDNPGFTPDIIERLKFFSKLGKVFLPLWHCVVAAPDNRGGVDFALRSLFQPIVLAEGPHVCLTDRDGEREGNCVFLRRVQLHFSTWAKGQLSADRSDVRRKKRLRGQKINLAILTQSGDIYFSIPSTHTFYYLLEVEHLNEKKVR